MKVNLGKSEVVLVGDVGNIAALAEILYCKVGSLPMSHLSMPLVASFKEKSVWNSVLEKMECRLVGWKKLEHLLVLVQSDHHHHLNIRLLS